MGACPHKEKEKKKKRKRKEKKKKKMFVGVLVKMCMCANHQKNVPRNVQNVPASHGAKLIITLDLVR